MDRNGRLLITPPLREYANLDKQTVLLGQGNKLELWDESVWNARRDQWLEVQSEGGMPDELQMLSL
jgi:MraZ protein